ncbi:cell division protein DedD [Pectobacterium brasiliense]|uniref:Cell division protein DedD n=1 Tax=Pectobacterium brasiliense TaxID=180957 RepID=A0A433NEW1_9GAMM|nr:MULTISPECIES: cell division protein DedD [Pectobacterium]GKW28629.1 cell division protein DedD [Pectobacterium carotovorum subsp. carotovorum]MBN3046195.1 cell division protein DedD [Pectobacterium brasiliense]MBN3076314.1 cell division protein DedD [Pectobacterium brasiliense]MBN3085445.1 cell division protein DedD [Pectobacterium brasiliense]MBN3087853.1 cell division protein DedD [Pectobacterium brasiliense]
MASKFQNRLVGTVILVALGVIVLPGLLDGKKKHYEDEFASIPLIPKPGDSNEMEALPALNPSLPSQPPEGAEAAMQNSAEAEAAEARSSASSTGPETTTQTPSSSHSGTNTPAMTAPPVVVERPPVQTPAPVTPKPQPKPEVKPEVKPKPEPKPEVKPEAQPTQQAPVGQAYIVQLGALKNSDKVNEIVAKLRLSGYRAYTVPSTPVSGEITRIYVGPDASKQKLESSLGELKQLSGLSGQVRAHSVR